LDVLMNFRKLLLEPLLGLSLTLDLLMKLLDCITTLEKELVATLILFHDSKVFSISI
jgi:hypothetical protein